MSVLLFCTMMAFFFKNMSGSRFCCLMTRPHICRLRPTCCPTPRGKEKSFETVKEEEEKKGAAESVKLFSPPSAFNVTIRLLFFRVGQPIKTPPPPPPPPPPPSGLKILFQLNIYIIIFRIEKAWRFLLLGPPGSIHFLFIVCRPEKKRSFH